MSLGDRFSIRRFVDILTIVVGLLAIWLVAQPESLLRVRASAAWSDRVTVRAAKKGWEEFIRESVTLGSGSQPPSLLMVTDYDCPFCRAMQPALDSLIAEGVVVAALRLPRSDTGRSHRASVDVICAFDASTRVAVHRAAMETQTGSTESSDPPERGSHSSPMNGSDVACEQRAPERLHRMRALAASLGVTGTPTIVSRHEVHRGLASLEQLRTLAAP
jgi:protein-disulfide isomerase